MSTSTLYITIIISIASLPWTGAQTSTPKPVFNRNDYLCKDERVTDETMAQLKTEDNKCRDSYLSKIRKNRENYDECLKVSDYSNDKVKYQDNKYQLLTQCSAKYSECFHKKLSENKTIDYQEDTTNEDVNNDVELKAYEIFMVYSNYPS